MVEKQKQMVSPKTLQVYCQSEWGHQRLLPLTRDSHGESPLILTNLSNFNNPTVTAGVFVVPAMGLHNTPGETALCGPHFGVQETWRIGPRDRPYLLGPGL